GSNPVSPNFFNHTKMSFRFYNSYTKQLEDFTPKSGNKVTIYSCGPTVYDLAHIGNFRTYIFTDILRRSLSLGGYTIEQAMNITDVDDKTIRKTQESNSDPEIGDLRRLTDHYIEFFFQDMKILGIDKVEHFPRATDYIDSMVDLTQRLLKSKYAYKQDDSVYFSITKFSDYGKLSGIDLSSVKSGTRYNADEYTKEDIRDFVLWKGEKGHEKIAWSTELGTGRPGWHLECSAMIHEIFQGPIDIHTGGIDLLFPHHENEIAQSLNAYGESFVQYWMHCEHLLVDGRKMSKSKGNFFTLRDVMEKGFHPATLRYFLFSSHYRQKLNFTLEALAQTRQTIRRIWNFYNRLLKITITDSPDKTGFESDLAKNSSGWVEDFIKELKDDLNTPRALAVFHEAIRQTNAYFDANGDALSKESFTTVQKAFLKMDTVINILSYSGEIEATGESDIPDEVNSLLEQRVEARKNKDYALSDQLRDRVDALGYVILDSPDGARLQKKEL
ncbi:MAG: cysteine--tRNA ligase, partial [Leptospirales bacterium]